MLHYWKKFKLSSLLHGRQFASATQQAILGNGEILEIQQQVHRQQLLKATHKVSSKQTGDFASSFYGQGMDFEESRLYQPGDDPRYMNWPLTARSGQFYMKIYREERQPGVFIFIDRRQSMRFATQYQLKVTQAVRLAAQLAFTALEQSFAVSTLVADEDMHWTRSSRKQSDILAMLNYASRPAPPIFDTGTGKSINALLMAMNKVIPAGSLVYLISDFTDLADTDKSLLYRLSSQHQVKAFHIYDTAELKLPRAGSVTLSTGHSDDVVIDTRSNTIQKKYTQKAASLFDSRKKLFEDCAIEWNSINCNDSSNGQIDL